MLLPMEQALKIILAHGEKVASEKVDLMSAQGRILREEIRAPWDFPRFSNTAMDGYALISEETQNASSEKPVFLKLTQEIPASRSFEEKILSGESARIFTGAAIPAGANAVEWQENVELEGDLVKITKPVKAGKSIRYQGSDLGQGELILEEGTVLHPGELALLASIGRSFIQVSQKPRIAVVSCGTELVEIDQKPELGQIIGTNRYGLSAQVRDAGGDPKMYPIAPDQKDSLRNLLQEGLKADILITSGGVSVGDYDLVRPTLEEIGVESKFWKVAVKPGKPLSFGIYQGRLVFGLPGNPVSAMVSFELFVRPAIRKILGLDKVAPPRIQAELTASAKPTSKR